MPISKVLKLKDMTATVIYLMSRYLYCKQYILCVANRLFIPAACGPEGFLTFGSYCLHFDSGWVSQASAVDYCTTLGATLTYPINPDDIEAWKTAVGEAVGGTN